MSTLLGYAAALEVIHATEDSEPCIIATRHNKITSIPLMQAIQNTRAVRTYLESGEYDKAVGSRGSMVEYLFNTVRHLEELGIHDPHLWRLQELVAERLDAMG